jgi:trans-aconitate methyltransferase
MPSGSAVPSPDPYARIAAAYDAEFDGAEVDVAGYADRLAGRRLLVLGCGTGRVNRGLASLCTPVGLDRSAPMIERARARGPATLAYEVGDMTAFDLGRFDEVIVPNAAFAFLPDRAARAAALSCIRRACPGGQLTLDLPMPDASLLGVPHTPEALAWAGTVEGRPLRRTREVFRSAVGQRLRLVDRYFDTSGCFTTSELVLHLFWPDEVEWMLEASGFYVEVTYGDHRGGPVREGCDRLLVVARPTPL